MTTTLIRRYHPAKSRQGLAILAGCFALLSLAVFSSSKILAQGGDIAHNLYRSRDALLTQKSELEGASNRIDQQMSELSRQQGRIQSYLKDTDRALKDIDIALQEVH